MITRLTTLLLSLCVSATATQLRLTDTGGDRATGYVMSNKIARRNGQLVCTWLDVERQNWWALVDPATAKILRTGKLGEPRKDNHCGCAIATDPDGSLHLLIGAHHGSFIHLRMPPGKLDGEAVEGGRAVGEQATYPSLVCDSHGTLHLLYRRETNGRDPHLMYCWRPKQGSSSAPRALVRSAVKEHSWLTNAIEVGPSNRLHAVFSNTLPVPDKGKDARYYSASHIYSDDGGLTWRQFGGTVLDQLPADAAKLERIETPESGSGLSAATLSRRRTEVAPTLIAGPKHSYYHKMVLSNPVLDDRGRPWVIVHNLLAGDAELFRHDGGLWLGTPLTATLPGYRVQHCGQLARHRDGTIEAVLMISPAGKTGWGENGTTLVRLLFNAEGRKISLALVRKPESDLAIWLPSLERWCPHAPVERPALLYTRGRNAGGYSKNVNDEKTEVWLEYP
ncbi:MAG: BNR repeat-containing protein [Verrucomicrobiae bacterium]|nr:BNR repeat-containing protein [Verrucomicrobiae bacterium]